MADTARRAWWSAGGWAIFQLTLTSLPGDALPGGINHPWDLLIHAGMYGMLGLLLARAAMLSAWPPPRLLLLGVAVVVYGALDELHQLLIPGRDASALDWLWDSVGLAAGLTVGTSLMASRIAVWLR